MAGGSAEAGRRVLGLAFTTQLALIAIATLSALYVNFTQTLHKRSMAATSGRRIVAGWLLCSGLPASEPKITASFRIAPARGRGGRASMRAPAAIDCSCCR